MIGRFAWGNVTSLGLVALAAAAGGCFYTDTINAEPRAQMEESPRGSHNKGDTVTFVANKSVDPDGAEGLAAVWRATSCDDLEGNLCPPANDFELGDGSIFDAFSFQIRDKRPIRIVLTVKDRRGAFSQDSVVIDVDNLDPSVSLQIQGLEIGGGFPLGTYVDIFATGMDPDEDRLSFDWSFFEPTGSNLASVGWDTVTDPDPDIQGRRLTPDVAGLWTVQVVATDGDGGSDTAQIPILVLDDAPPCIGQTEPVADPNGTYIADTVDGPRRFAVLSVNDDLDRFPEPSDLGDFLGVAGFRWFVATPDTGGEFVEVQGHVVSDYLVDPGAFFPGDRIAVRAEVGDRIDRTIPCAVDQPTCSIGGDTCLQRVTWEVEVR